MSYEGELIGAFFALCVMGSMVFLGLYWRSNVAAAVRMTPIGVFRLLWALFLDSVYTLFVMYAIWAAIEMPSAPTLVMGVLGAVSLFPYPLAKAVCVPMGWSECAWRLAVLSHVSFWNDRRAGAAATGARALMRKRAAHPDAVAALERLLAPSLMEYDIIDTRLGEWIRWFFRMPFDPRANAMYGVGAICAVRGDLSGARNAFTEVEHAQDADGASEAVRMAREWRCADAVERGYWSEVIAVGGLARPRPTPSVRFMVAMARRMLGGELAPDDAALIALWTRCPGRKALEPLLTLARAVPRGALPESPPPQPDDANPLARALRLHMRLSKGAMSQPVDVLRALGDAWDEALQSRAFRDRFAARAVTLGAPGGKAVLDDLASQVQAQIAGFVARDCVDIEDIEGDSATLHAVARKLRDEPLRALETSIAGLQRRVDDDRRLPGRTEQEEMDELFRQYAEIAAVSGQRGRELAFHVMHETLSAYGVWLFNKRRQRKLGHRVFCFIMMQACIVGDEPAQWLHAHNARIGF